MSRVTILNYLEAISDLKKNSYRHLSNPPTILLNGNNFILEKQSHADELFYLAKDEKGNDKYIECIPASFFEFSEYERRFSEISGLIQRFGVSKSYEYFQNSFLLISDAKCRITLNEFLLFKNCVEIPKIVRDQAKLSVEMIIRIARQILGHIFYLKKSGKILGNISPDTLCFEITKDSKSCIFVSDNGGVEIKIDMINKSYLNKDYLLYPDVYPYDNQDVIDV